MSQLLMLAAVADRNQPLVVDALARARTEFPDATIDLALLSGVDGGPVREGPITFWPVKVRLFEVPRPKGPLATLQHVAAINLNSRRRAAAAHRSAEVRRLAGQADVIISLSTPTDRAALRLGRRSSIPLVAGMNAALAARRRGEW
ncbi:MAG: hypothetical protein ACOX61_08840 [Brooklawnia sp.]|jgi:hypothetical protein